MKTWKKIIIVIFIIWALVKSLIASKFQIVNETEWIWRHPLASSEEKLRDRTSPEFYDFIKFVEKNTPEDVVIMIPPQTWPWPFSGHIEYLQYFLYPRRLVKDDREKILTDKSITHIFINWGEGTMDDERLQGYPKYYVPVKKIITASDEETSYPARAPYFDRFGLIEVERGENEKESLAGIKQGTAQYHFHKAEFLRARGQFGQAISELEKALRIKPDYAWISFLLGDTWEKLGREDLAISFYQKAIKQAPEIGWFYYALGQAYEKQGKENQAVSAYKENLAVSPDNIWSSFALGRIYEKRGDLVNAVLSYEQTNFLNWGPNSLDSRMGLEAAKRLKENNPGLLGKLDLLRKVKERGGESKLSFQEEDGKEGVVEEVDDFEDKTSGVPSGDLKFIPGVADQAVSLAGVNYHIAYPLAQFSPKEGSIEFFWKPAADIGKLSDEEVIDLLHQLGHWLKPDGSIYLWAGKDYLGFGMFDARRKKWHFLASEKVQWNPQKWYLLAIGFGEKGMKLFIDGKFQAGNDFQKRAAEAVVSLGGGREVSFFDFPKLSSIGHGSFDKLVYYHYQKE